MPEIPFIRQFDDLAENMANPNPNRPISNAVAQFGRTVCDRISARPDLFAPTVLQSPLRAACEPYWNSQGYDGPELVPPFTGGQCPGVSYRANWTVSQAGTVACFDGSPSGLASFSGTTGNMVGPIVAIDKVLGGNTCQGQRGFVQWVARNAANQSLILVELGSPSQTSFGLSAAEITVSWERLSGSGDCGDPDPVPVPGPDPAPDPGPLPPETGPQVDIRGNVFLALPGSFPITANFTLELAPGEINLGSGTGGSTPVEPLPGDELEGDGSGEGGGENDFGDPPPGERWVGCCVRITDIPTGAGVIPSSLPHDVYPTIIGNARLKFRSGEGPAQYDTPIQNRAETSCLWEPVRGLAPIGAFVNLLPGYSYTVTPYSVPLEQ